MKKWMAILLVAVMCLSLAACGSSSGSGGGGRDVISGFDGSPALNLNTVGKHITRVELTVDNWKEYIKEYSYTVEVVERDAFDEITKQETVTVYRLGYGTDKYHCLSATIELKHKQTDKIILLGETLPGNLVKDINAVHTEPLHLDEYECTRIKGYIYFIDYPEETLEKVINVFDRQYYQRANGYILVSSKSFEGNWNVDSDAKVIESNSDDWKKHFE